MALAPAVTQRLPGHPAGAVARAIDHDLARRPADAASAALAQVYRARDWRPLWVGKQGVRPPAWRLIAMVRGARADDLDPARYHPDRLQALAARAGDRKPADLARAEIAFSRALGAFVGDLRRAPPQAQPMFVDAAVKPPATAPGAILAEAAAAPDLGAWLTSAAAVNPIYRRLAADLSSYRGPKAALVRANLERARALPASLGKRFVLVDIPAQTLWFYDGGKAVGSMKVVVGKTLPDGGTVDETPVMDGMIRWAVLDPYWWVPPDMARQDVAPKMLRGGPGALARQDLQAVSSPSADAAVIDPASIDWAAVAAGTGAVFLRQPPGPANMMGQIKFVFPNPLGIYLHDTPSKGLFEARQRDFSHGCVRLQDAPRLAAWLFGRPLAPPPGRPPEDRVALAPPVPVYIVYLTAWPGPDGLVFWPDIYHRDPSLLASMEKGRAGAG
ncbi:MAG TPA: L,D-transpeptidase family protein [Caulobacteraceae bacterium]|nr:L,D-transpeptidase family protein [Caulobacteraceae bacterium]